MKISTNVRFVVILLVAISSTPIIVSGLECYSCDSDLTDLDCNDVKTLPKQVCQPVSDSNMVAFKCGHQHVKVNSTERIFRGCMVAGECDLLLRQIDLTSKFRMESCQECDEDNCNGRSGGMVHQARLAGGVGFSVLVGLVIGFLNRHF